MARIRELLNRKSFWPFRLFLSYGSHHDVLQPEFAWVIGGRIFPGVPLNGDPDADVRIKELAVLHLPRVGELRSRKPKK